MTDTKAAFDLLKMDYSDVMVRREWKNIDILVESKEEKYVLCIENKVGIKDHSGQLDRYFDIINYEYPEDYNKIFLYLTPDGSPPKEDSQDAWKTIRYETFIDIIANELKKTVLEPKRKLFIENYLETLRREMMDNAEIVKICQDIYRKHKNALDLIYEYRPDKLQNFYEIVREWCIGKHNKEEILFDESRSSKSYCRFRTKIMDEIIPDSQSVRQLVRQSIFGGNRDILRQDRAGNRLCRLHRHNCAVVRRRPSVAGKPPLRICRRRDDRRRIQLSGDPFRQRVGAADMPRQNRDHIAAALIDHQHSRVGRLIPQIRRDRPNRDTAGADEHQGVVPVKQRLHIRENTVVRGEAVLFGKLRGRMHTVQR